jgi:hypothetical protein
MVAQTHSVVAILLLCTAALAAAVGVVLLVLRARRGRRVRPETSIAPLVRRFEEEQLARMEADGVKLWKPDPDKLRRMTASVRD